MSEFYNNPISFTSQFYFCPVPLRLDTYSGCTHNCKYCFANNSNQKFISRGETLGNEVNDKIVKPTKIEFIKEYFDVAFEDKPNKFDNQEAIAIEALRHRVPLHFGGMSDGFQPPEETENISYETLKLLKKYNYPTILSTKGKTILKSKYIDLINDFENIAIQVSLIDTRQEVLDLLEPNSSSFLEREQILQTFKNKFTAIRIQPVIPFITEEEIPKIIELAKSLNVNHIMTEGLKLMSSNPAINEEISKVFKLISNKEFDLIGYYKSIGSKFSGNDLELPSWRKYQYIKPTADLCKKYNIQYGSADNDLRLFGDTPCCCGIENLKGFENTLKCNIGHAGFRACGLTKNYSKKEKFNFNIIKNEYMPKGNFRLVMSNEKLKNKYGADATYKSANQNILKLFIDEWQSGGKNSPQQMINFELLDKVNEDGFKFYRILTTEELNKKLKGFTQKTLDLPQ